MPLPASSSLRFESATLASRAGAVLVDLLGLGVVAAIGLACTFSLANGCKVPGCEILVVLGPVAGFLVLAFVQASSFATRGQTLGMRSARIQVVGLDGRRAGVGRGLGVRAVVVAAVPVILFGVGELVWETSSRAADSKLVAALGYNRLDLWTTSIPLFGSLAWILVDVLPVFFPPRRCLHDRLARTAVARVTDPAELSG